MAEKFMQKAAAASKANGTEGSFRAYCQARGYKQTTCECVAAAKKSKDPLTVKRATLAGVYMKCGSN